MRFRKKTAEGLQPETLAEAYGSTLCADLWYCSCRINDVYRRLYFPNLYARLHRVTREDVADPEWMKSMNVTAGLDWVRHVDRITIKRKAFRTTDGILGNCPDTAQAGDEIMIVPGGDVPLILRCKEHIDDELDGGEDGGKKWNLIGECYVHGMMDGGGLRP